MFRVDPAQGVQDRFLGADRQAGTARHPVLTQWYGPSGQCRIDVRNALAQSKIHQEQLSAVEDILAIVLIALLSGLAMDAGARYC